MYHLGILFLYKIECTPCMFFYVSCNVDTSHGLTTNSTPFYFNKNMFFIKKIIVPPLPKIKNNLRRNKVSISIEISYVLNK